MRSRKFTKKLSIEQKSTTPSATGHPATTWSPYLTAYGAVDPVRGNERLAFAALASEVDYKVTLTFSPAAEGITAAMRVVYGSLVFNVKAVLVAADRRSVELLCSSGVNAG